MAPLTRQRVFSAVFGSFRRDLRARMRPCRETAAAATEVVLPMLLAKCCSGISAVISAQFFAGKIFTPAELG